LTKGKDKNRESKRDREREGGEALRGPKHRKGRRKTESDKKKKIPRIKYKHREGNQART
jgi:hypothetical protein